MFKLFSNSKGKDPVFDFSLLKADMHSHLLPGIDDGSPDLESSLDFIRGLAALGYKKLITTPHIFWDMYKNTPEIIGEKLAIVQQAVATAGIDIEIHAAAEYFLDEHMEELLSTKQPLLRIKDNLVLTEFSMMTQPLGIKDMLFEMQMQGYQPIIAHPERYAYLERNKEFYDELKDLGCHFQLNILSLTGGYGRAVTELAQYLLKKNFYSFAGTDLHHSRHLEALSNPKLTSILQKMVESGLLMNDML